MVPGVTVGAIVEVGTTVGVVTTLVAETWGEDWTVGVGVLGEGVGGCGRVPEMNMPMKITMSNVGMTVRRPVMINSFGDRF
jgi:hypothetical protein